MHCSAICLRVTRSTLPWPARPVLLLVFYTSVSFMCRLSCSLHTRNALILPAAGGAPSSLLQDSQHNSVALIVPSHARSPALEFYHPRYSWNISSVACGTPSSAGL